MNYYLTFPTADIIYRWWCNICWAFHYYPEECPFDDMGYNEEEEYYYGIR